MLPCNRPAAPLVLVLALVAGSMGSYAADSNPNSPSRLAPIEGSTVQRVTLSEEAAQRLGIMTGQVSDQEIARIHTMEGKVLVPPYPQSVGTFLASGIDPSLTIVQVPRSETAAFATLGLTASVRPRDALGGIVSPPAQLVTISQPEKSDYLGDLFFTVEGKELGLTELEPVLVELSIKGGVQKTIPTSALFYDEQGLTWVYINPEPLVFVRHPVSVDFVQADTAVLTEGPESGVVIVTVGAMLLLGAEFGVGH